MMKRESVPRPNVRNQKLSMRVENFIETSHGFRHSAAAHLSRSRGTQVGKHCTKFFFLFLVSYLLSH